MKKEKKGLIVLMAIAGLLLVGNVIGYLQPIFAGEDQTVQTTDGTNIKTTASSAILEEIDDSDNRDHSTQVSSSEASETAEEVDESDESDEKVSKARLIKATADETAVWGTEAAATKIIEVDNWSDFNKAVTNGFSGDEAEKNDADYIKVTASFSNPQTGTGSSSDRPTLPVNRVDFVVDGLGNTIHFHGTSYSWRSNSSDVRKVYVKDLAMYGTNYYGPFQIGTATSLESELAIENVYYEGGQITASYQATMRFIGKNTIKSVNSYEDPFTPGRIISTQGNQSGLEAFRAVFEENSETEVEVENGNGFILASYYGNTGSTLGEDAYALLKSKAKVNITTLGSTGENYGVGYYVLALNKGDVIVEDEAELTLNTAKDTTKGGIELAGGTSIDISNKAKVNININGQMGGTRNAISIGNDSILKVRDEGELHVNLANQGNDNRDVITAGSDSTFEIGRKSVFNIKLADGTGSRNLIDIGARGAFRFADAYSIDLDARANTNAHLINMSNPGHFIADVQKVSTWLKSDPTTLYKSWAPIYGVDVTYNRTNQTGLLGQSVTNAITDDFLANYYTSGRSGSGVLPTSHTGFSRVLFEFIEDVNIGINDITDNPNEDAHKEFSGVVNPDPEYGNGTAISFYYVDRDDYTEDDPPPLDRPVGTPAVASPLEGDERVFHTIADSFTGDYQFTVPEDEREKLVAGQKIMAVGWLNGKENYAITTVKDTTAPTADGRSYIVEKGVMPPNADVFLENVQDTNPMENQTFAISYKTDISELVHQPTKEGHVIEINVTDEAGNTATVEAKLIVYDEGTGIDAKDIEIDATDIKDKTEAEIKDFILAESSASAFYLKDGAEVDVTEKIEVADLGGLSTASGEYTVKLIVPADVENGLQESITKEIVVTVKDVEPPTGTGKHTLVPLNKADYLIGSDVDLFKFLSTYQDNVTEAEELQIRLVEDTNEIETLVSSVGSKVVHVILTDKAQNDSEPIEIPITVVEGEVSGNVAITGEDFRLDRSEWENAVTENQLKEFILANGQVEAVELVEGVVTSVTDTDKVSIDVEEVIVDSAHEEQPMTITLTVDNGTDKVSKTIQVTFNDKTAPTAEPKPTEINIGNVNAIQNADPKIFLENLTDNVSEVDKISVEFAENQDFDEMVQTPGPKELLIELVDEAGNKAIITVEITIFDNSLTIRFVDSKDQDIVTPVVISDKIPGDKVDLTAEQAVLKGLQEAEDLHYLLLTRPEDEDQVEVTSTGKIVKYEFDGTLFISSYPKTLDFETHQVWFSDIRVDKPQYQEPLVIWDNRGIKANWTLTATLTKDFTLQAGDVDDPNFVLTDVLSYQKTTEENSAVVLHDEAEAVYSAQHAEDQSEYNISDTWDENGPGLKFETTAANVKKLGDYQAEILWTLGDAR